MIQEMLQPEEIKLLYDQGLITGDEVISYFKPFEAAPLYVGAI